MNKASLIFIIMDLTKPGMSLEIGRRASASNFERMGKARAAGKGTSGLAKTSSFFTPITAHSMFDYSIILELD